MDCLIANSRIYFRKTYVYITRHSVRGIILTEILTLIKTLCQNYPKSNIFDSMFQARSSIASCEDCVRCYPKLATAQQFLQHLKHILQDFPTAHFQIFVCIAKSIHPKMKNISIFLYGYRDNTFWYQYGGRREESVFHCSIQYTYCVFCCMK